jgi:hypothetical protein
MSTTSRISDMSPLAALPASGARVPVVEDGSTVNYLYDLGADLAARGNVVATRTALAALTVHSIVYLTESGREGVFIWSSANLSAFATADANQGIYVAPTSAPTGASGAWVRKFSTDVDPKWFGLSYAASAATNFAAWTAMMTCLASRATASGTARSLEKIRFTDDATYNFGANTLDLLYGQVDIEGVCSTSDAVGTTLQFSGATGIRVQRYNTSGASGTRAGAYGADGSIIRKLRLKGGYTSTEGEFHGVHLRAAAFVEDCTFSGFEGDGVFVDGNTNNFPDESRFVRCRSINCRKGFYTDGGDANVCSFDGCDARVNRTWGFYDSSFLGCSYYACHSASNGWDGAIGSFPTGTSYGGNRYYVKVGQAVGAKTNAPSGTTADNTWWGYIAAGGVYNGVPAWVTGTYDFREGGAYKTDDPNAANILLNVYSEGDQNPSQFLSPTVVVGGLHGAQVKGSAAYLRHGSTSGSLAVERLTVMADPNNAIDLNSRDATANFSLFAQTNQIQFYNGSTINTTLASTGDLITNGFLQMTGELAIRASGSSALRIDARDASQAFYLFDNASTLNFYSNSAIRATLTAAGVFNATGTISGSNLNTSGLPTSVSASKLLGNPTGSPAAGAEIGLSSDLAFSGSNLQIGAFTGDIVKSAGSLATTIRNGVALSIIGRSANSTGAVADISGANNQVLRVSGSVLGFGAVDVSTAQITGRLPYANLTQGSALSVLGVTGNATADVASMAGTADQVLRVNTAGTALAFGTIATAGITAAAVTYAKVQSVAASSLLGNPTGGATAVSEITLAGGLGFSGTTLTLNGAVTAATSVAVAGAITSSSASAGVGYATGAGGTVTQITSRTTGVTINKTVGEITLVSAAGSATYQTFTVTNSSVAATDRIILNQKSGTDLYILLVTNLAAGSFKISFATTGGTTTEQPVIGFTVLKGANA